jgi:hypothetical protein
MGNASPQVRGQALAVLSMLAAQRPDWVAPLVPQLQALAKQDTWWEVQVRACLRVCALSVGISGSLAHLL